MATTKYDVYADQTFLGQRARKDAAIKLGEGSGTSFEVRASGTGAVVHSHQVEAPAPAKPEAPAPAKPTKEKNVTEKTATKPKDGTPLEFTHGAKYFFREMGASAIKVVESLELEAELDGPTRSIVVSGGTAKQRQQAIKKIDSFLTEMYAAFKAWKRDNRDKRKTWYESPEGRKAMTKAETSFFDKYTDTYLAGDDVI